MGDSVEEVDDTSSADELAAQFMSRNVMGASLVFAGVIAWCVLDLNLRPTPVAQR